MAALDSATTVPEIVWAQRKDSLYVTIKLVEATGVKVDLTATTLAFSAESEEKAYAFDLAFFAEVVPEESVWKVHGRNVQMHVVKKAAADEHWPRASTDKAWEKRHVACDWSRYVDEDEEAGDDGFDLSALDGAANFGDAQGDEYEPDSDDDVDLDDLDPDLEPGAPNAAPSEPK